MKTNHNGFCGMAGSEAFLREKFIALNAYIRKGEKGLSFNFSFKKLEKVK